MSRRTNWMLFMLIMALYLLLCFITPADSAWLLSNLTELVLNAPVPANTEIMPQILDPQIINSMMNETSSRDPFYGVSRAAPGSFQLMVQRWFLRMASSTITPSTWTSAVTSPTSTVTSAASALGLSSLLTGFIYGAWVAGTIVTMWKW